MKKNEKYISFLMKKYGHVLQKEDVWLPYLTMLS